MPLIVIVSTLYAIDAPCCDRIWVMQKYFFQLLPQGLLLGVLVLGMAGCDRKSNPFSSASSPSPSRDNESSVVPKPTSKTSPEPSNQGNTALQGNSSSPATSPDIPLNPEDQALSQDVQKDLQVKGVKLAMQSSGQIALGNVLLSQQAEHLVKRRFASDMKQLSGDMPSEIEEYYLQILQADANKTIVTATAKVPGLPSYTGAVFAVQAKVATSKICKTKVPSEMPPSPPTLIGEVIKCGDDSVDAGQ
jgi:Type IV pilin-like G and H, putative